MDDIFLEKWPKWLRWALAWPAGVLGSLIIAFVMRLLWSGTNENTAPWFLDLIQAGLIGYLAVYIPSLFAPGYKKVVSIISICTLVGIVFLVSGFVIYGLIMGGKLDNPILFWIGVAIYIAGGVVAITQVHDEVA